MAPEGWFLQKIAYRGQALDLALIERATYIETLDLGGPKLIVTFRDEYALLRDDIGLRPGEVLDVTFADYFHPEGDELIEQMTILAMPDCGDTITLHCMARPVWLLKVPAVRAVAWVKKPVETILRHFFRDAKMEVEGFPVRCDYHLLPGDRPSKMLRQFASELGARIYYHRKTVYAQRLETLMAKGPVFTTGYNDTRRDGSDYKIVSYDRPNASVVMSDGIDRRWCGWDMIDGMVYASRGAEFPREFCHASKVAVLNSLSGIPLPEVDFVLAGMGQLKPGETLATNWYLNRIDSPMDESLPPKIVIGTAAHHYQAQKYLTRIKGVTPR